MTPYLLMLLDHGTPYFMAAAHRPDFQSMYPKLELVTAHRPVRYASGKPFLFEICYGTDFLTIELFSEVFSF